MTSRLWSTLVVAFLFVGLVGGPAAGTASGVEPDRVVMDVAVEADGDARWRVAYRFRLSDENASAAFEELQASVEQNASAYRERFTARMERTVRAAENETGREMTVRNVSVRTSREDLTEYGVVTYRFRWTGFAVVSGDRLLVGDVLDSLYLDRRTTLVLSWQDGYRASAIEPTPDRRHDGSVAWVGPSQFDSGEPRLVLKSAPTATVSTGATVDRGDDPGNPFPVSGVVFGGGVLAVGLVVGAVLHLTFQRDGPVFVDPRNRMRMTNPAPDDESLMTPEERILALLQEEGGRMKQARVAEQLDWTAAKTSRIVGDLRDAGEVDTFRVGRENVVALPE